MCRPHSVLALAVGLSWGSPGFGQSGAAAAAEALFQEGKELQRSGQEREACAKFEESQRLDPSAGTLMNLARCREEEGKLASAWAMFEEARRTTTRPHVREEAEERARSLKQRLSYLRIEVERVVPSLVVRYGTVTLGEPAYGTPVPVDPGELTVSASAPGYVDWSTKISAKGPGTVVVHIPQLIKLEEPPKKAPAEVRPIGPWLLGGAGIAALGVGATLGLVAKSHYDTAEGLCPTHEDCGDDAMSEWNKADALATTSTILVPVGALALTGGVVWWLVSEPKKTSAARYPQVTLTGHGGFVTYRGEF